MFKNTFLDNQLKCLRLVFNSRNSDGKIFWLGQGTEVDNSIPYDDGSGLFRMRYREAACNWLICAVLDVIFNKPHYFDESPGDGDGFIISGSDKILTEHVMVYNHNQAINSEEEKIDYINKSILLKLKKGGSFETGKRYLKAKLLVVNIATRTSDTNHIDYCKVIRGLCSQVPYLPKRIIFIHCNHDDTWTQLWDLTFFSMDKKRFEFNTYQIQLDLENIDWEVGFVMNTTQNR